MSKLFYLRDSRSNVGNTCIFWAKDGCGYTSDLSKAETYTLEEARYQFNMRNTDIPLCKTLVDGVSTARVDSQYISTAESKDCGNVEYVIQIEGFWDGNDVFWRSAGMKSVNYEKAISFLGWAAVMEVCADFYEEGIRVTAYPKSYIDGLARRTLQVKEINERKMITAAGIRKPKMKRIRPTTGRTKGNCPECGRITWGLNPYEPYTCYQAENEKKGFDIYDCCDDVRRLTHG